MKSQYHDISSICTVTLTAAAKSICPPAAAGLATLPAALGGAAPPGRGAAGTGGFPGIFGATAGLFATGGGGAGLGFAATGGGPGFAAELAGRE